MSRPQSIENEQLLARLSLVFRQFGYDGASLSVLSEATGLKKASLYHRFPEGKRQMAEEVLAAALSWFEANILEPLRESTPPAQRIATVAAHLDTFYEGGRQACLLNMLSAPHDDAGPFTQAIRSAFEAMIAAFAVVARDAGHDVKVARLRAERAVTLLHGSLVVSRGLGSTKPFKSFLSALEDTLIGGAPSSR